MSYSVKKPFNTKRQRFFAGMVLDDATATSEEFDSYRAGGFLVPENMPEPPDHDTYAPSVRD